MQRPPPKMEGNLKLCITRSSIFPTLCARVPAHTHSRAALLVSLQNFRTGEGMHGSDKHELPRTAEGEGGGGWRLPVTLKQRR